MANYKKIGIPDPPNLEMTCQAIKARQTFSNVIYPEEAHFPIAFVKVVYTNYLTLEFELATNFNPNNIYMFVMDKKAPKMFQYRMRQLSNCFVNVLVSEKTFDLKSSGYNIFWHNITA
ncbi:unnamed protein product [Bursaphelenchus okinawaensis]|uniref:Uncharacterized protein n=1 Tax=Bursaphelenchus okinawaensis TaxID=465554 RepID=A0A811KCN5_9BILA|nr:unnamed protein product [Bursaphelenchus okinawaensis]CAG9101038.1 unnamed protein product [Bursaphelenchus okinawaensis]